METNNCTTETVSPVVKIESLNHDSGMSRHDWSSTVYSSSTPLSNPYSQAASQQMAQPMVVQASNNQRYNQVHQADTAPLNAMRNSGPHSESPSPSILGRGEHVTDAYSQSRRPCHPVMVASSSMDSQVIQMNRPAQLSTRLLVEDVLKARRFKALISMRQGGDRLINPNFQAFLQATTFKQRRQRRAHSKILISTR